MYGQHGHHIMSATVSSGTSLSQIVPITGYNQFAIEFPTFISGTNLKSATANAYIQVCNTSTGGTFRRLVVMGQYSGGSGLKDWEVPAFSGDRIVLGPALTGMFSQLKVELSISALTAGCLVNVHCMQ